MGRLYAYSEIVKRLEDKSLNPDTLSKHDRKLLAEYLTGKNKNAYEIASLLNVSPTTIYHYRTQSRKDMCRLVTIQDTDARAKETIAYAHRCINRAEEAGDYKTVWQVTRELNEQLGKMGYIHYKGDPIHVQVGDNYQIQQNNLGASPSRITIMRQMIQNLDEATRVDMIERLRLQHQEGAV
jgi:predicted transcriptional regulator